MKKIFIFIVFILASCNKKEQLEIELVTEKINYLKVNKNEFLNYIPNNKVAIKEARTILVYKLINNTSKTYYFNLEGFNNDFDNDIKVDRAFVRIEDQEGKNVNVKARSPSMGFESKYLYLDYLNYNYGHKMNSKNFIIHPDETLYFEWFIVLPFGNRLEETNYSVDLDANQKYFAELLMYSDGMNYKKQISRTDLQTIQENGYEVYNGVIKSKNKVPIVFNEVLNK